MISAADFEYKSIPIDSWLMNKVFKMTEETVFLLKSPEQPAAGKIQYYFEITDNNGKTTYFENEPIVIRYKGAVPSKFLLLIS